MPLEFAIWDHFERQDGVPRAEQYAERIGSTRHLIVADTDEQARAIARRACIAYQDHFFATEVRTQGARMPRTSVADNADLRIESGQLLAGSPDTVRRALQQFLETAGPGHTYLAGAFQWGDMTHAEAMRSLHLYATEVMPALAEGRAAIAI